MPSRSILGEGRAPPAPPPLKSISDKIPKDNEYCTCLSVVLLDSILVNSDKEYYPQIFLEECKYTMENRKIVNTISKDLELNESDESDA